MYDLDCRFDSRQSFYGKAKIEITRTTYEQTIDLYSYGTLVASIIDNFNSMIRKYIYKGQYSQTTTRHQKEFFKQNGLSDKEIKELFKNGILEKGL
jgi:hypothetical protein